MLNLNFTLTPEIANQLIHLETLRIELDSLPITPHILASLRESSRLSSVHYSTMIAGNRLTAQEVAQTIKEYTQRSGKKRDITACLEYFCKGMVESFENVKRHAMQASKKGVSDVSSKLRKLDPRQRLALTLFEKFELITSTDIANLLGIQQRTARNVCQEWIKKGFIVIADEAKKSRKYALASEFHDLLKS